MGVAFFWLKEVYMKCSIHPEREAIGTCVECGLAFCEECKVVISNKNYCKKCVEIVVKKGKITQRNPTIAALLSFIIGGAGQLYNGQIGKGILIFLTTWLIIPWIYGIFDAYNTANKINKGEIVTERVSGCLIAVIVVFITMWVIAIISLLAAIAIPNLLRARLVANESAAKATIRTIATALETYAASSNGEYPSDESALTDAQPPYINDSYNNKTMQGYSYSLKLKSNGYRVIAKPSQCLTTGTKIFQIETGGIVSEEKCQ